MGYKTAATNFRFNCILRVLALAATITLLVVMIPQRQHFTLLLLGALAVGQVWSLIRYIEYTNRSLIVFLQSVEFGDFSTRVTSGPSGKSFSGLVDVFNDILVRFREMDTAREENLRYLMAVVQHIDVGLLVSDQQGEVVMLNHAARRLLDIPRLGNLSELATVSPELLASVRDQTPGGCDVVTISVGGQMHQLSVHTSELRQRQQALTLVSLQNISPELNEKEMDAWRNLIRVLTHEIKNSLTPIASLAASVEQMTVGETINDCCPSNDNRSGRQESEDPDVVTVGSPGHLTSTEQAEKIQAALQIIQKRSQGLLHFVDSYRDLTNLPQPDVTVFTVADLFARVDTLIVPQLAGQAEAVEAAGPTDQVPVYFNSHIDPPSMKLTGDSRLIEQVLINLVINAADSIRSQPNGEIKLNAYFDDRSRPVVEVIDNGPGILAESLEKVFVPFYSTKPEGTGIGLSWSRQILRMHRGELIVRSDPGVETAFVLRF